MIPRQVQQQHPAVHHWEPGHEILKKNTQKNHTNPVQGALLRDLPEWLGDFTENLVEEGVPASNGAPADFSHDSDPERPFKVASRKHNFLNSLPKKTKIARSARKP